MLVLWKQLRPLKIRQELIHPTLLAASDLVSPMRIDFHGDGTIQFEHSLASLNTIALDAIYKIYTS